MFVLAVENLLSIQRTDFAINDIKNVLRGTWKEQVVTLFFNFRRYMHSIELKSTL